MIFLYTPENSIKIKYFTSVAEGSSLGYRVQPAVRVRLTRRAAGTYMTTVRAYYAPRRSAVRLRALHPHNKRLGAGQTP